MIEKKDQGYSGFHNLHGRGPERPRTGNGYRHTSGRRSRDDETNPGRGSMDTPTHRTGPPQVYRGGLYLIPFQDTNLS